MLAVGGEKLLLIIAVGLERILLDLLRLRAELLADRRRLTGRMRLQRCDRGGLTLSVVHAPLRHLLLEQLIRRSELLFHLRLRLTLRIGLRHGRVLRLSVQQRDLRLQLIELDVKRMRIDDLIHVDVSGRVAVADHRQAAFRTPAQRDDERRNGDELDLPQGYFSDDSTSAVTSVPPYTRSA